jgi:hypothetical protein
MKKVLVSCPTADVKDYCFSDWVNQVQNLTYKNYDIHVVDNSDNREFYDKWKEIIPMSRVSPQNYDSVKSVMAKSHDLCRKKALDGGYEYLLHLESDIFCPNDIIESLMSHNKKIVGATYHIGVGEDSQLMIQQIENFGDALRETYTLKSGDLSFIDGTVKRVFSCGLGCVLIHRSVLSKFKFRYEKGANVHPDSFFFYDMNSIGEKVYVDTDIYCNHENTTMLR